MIFWYTTAVDYIRDLLTDICLIGAAAFSVAWLVLISRGRLARVADRIAKMPRSAVAAFLIFAAIATVCAQKSATNEPPRGVAAPQSVSVAENWWRRGAWKDFRRVEFAPGWVFPFGGSHLAHVDVVSQGSVRAKWTDTNDVASVGARLALVPFASVFSHEFTPSNSYRFVWSGALAERRADAPVDAAIELFRDGSVSVETNGVEWRVERVWEYGETSGITSRADAEAAVAGDWQYVFAVDFPTAPPETVCLCVGTNRVAVSEACECCFVLDKGTRHGISLSFVPDGVTCSWGGAPERSGPARSGLVTERMRAYGSPGEVEFDDPADDGEGSVFWGHSLYIAPDSLDDPAYPVRLLAWMDIPPGEWPRVTWSGGDGEISESGEWLTLESRPASDMVCVTAAYRGKTWRGYVVFWTDVEEDVVALDGGGTIFVESAYTNYPGELTVRTSTEQRLAAHWALCNDGTLTLSATDGAAVDVRVDSPEGPVVDLPFEWYGYAGDVDSLDFYVVNNDPSRAGESVTFELVFDGDIEGHDSDTSGPLEVVKYRVEAKSLWPSNRVRHVFGPLERFDVKIEDGTEFDFTAPLTPGECGMSFDYNGSTCTFPIRVVAPNGIAGTLRAYDYSCSGSVIGAGFTAHEQVLPTYVSFEGLEIMEDEAPVSSRWGCFLNLRRYPHDQFAHTPARGAGRHLPILVENKIDGYDHVQTRLGELPGSDGGCSVNIPLKWGISGGPYSHDAGHVLQTVQVQTNGTVSVSKFGITATRRPNEDYQ